MTQESLVTPNAGAAPVVEEQEKEQEKTENNNQSEVNRTGNSAKARANRGESHGDLGASEVQEKVNAAEEKGFYGVTPDETPNYGYTFAGSVKAAEKAKREREEAK